MTKASNIKVVDASAQGAQSNLISPAFMSEVTVAQAKAIASFKWTSEHDHAFPDVDPGIEAAGNRVLVQIRSPMKKTKGGIYLTDDGKDTELWNTQVGLVRQVAPLCYRDRSNMSIWPEGTWCSAGAFVRVPKYGGDRWQVNVPGSDTPALFVIFKDVEVIGRVRFDPLSIRAFI